MISSQRRGISEISPPILSLPQTHVKGKKTELIDAMIARLEGLKISDAPERVDVNDKK